MHAPIVPFCRAQSECRAASEACEECRLVPTLSEDAGTPSSIEANENPPAPRATNGLRLLFVFPGAGARDRDAVARIAAKNRRLTDDSNDNTVAELRTLSGLAMLVVAITALMIA